MEFKIHRYCENKCAVFRTVLYGCVLLTTGCGGDAGSFADSMSASGASSKYLYVASGYCYAGGIAAATGSNVVTKYDMNGNLKLVIADYSNSPGDQPVGLSLYDSANLLVGVENTSTRRIEKINKNELGRSTFISNSTALNQNLRSVQYLSDGGVLVAKSGVAPNGAVEKFNYSGARVTMGANPYINAPVGAASVCATATSTYTGAIELSNGKILYAHAVATTGNKVGMINSTGYAVAADCNTAVSGPATTALPTAMILHSSGKLIVGYSSTTAGSNYIYAYDVDAGAGTITGATLSYNNISNIYGISAMAEDASTGNVYIASAASAYNTIEKFSFDSTTKTMTRIGSTPFITTSVYTRCISGIAVAD